MLKNWSFSAWEWLLISVVVVKNHVQSSTVPWFWPIQKQREANFCMLLSLAWNWWRWCMYNSCFSSSSTTWLSRPKRCLKMTSSSNFWVNLLLWSWIFGAMSSFCNQKVCHEKEDFRYTGKNLRKKDLKILYFKMSLCAKNFHHQYISKPSHYFEKGSNDCADFYSLYWRLLSPSHLAFCQLLKEFILNTS